MPITVETAFIIAEIFIPHLKLTLITLIKINVSARIIGINPIISIGSVINIIGAPISA